MERYAIGTAKLTFQAGKASDSVRIVAQLFDTGGPLTLGSPAIPGRWSLILQRNGLHEQHTVEADAVLRVGVDCVPEPFRDRRRRQVAPPG